MPKAGPLEKKLSELSGVISAKTARINPRSIPTQNRPSFSAHKDKQPAKIATTPVTTTRPVVVPLSPQQNGVCGNTEGPAR
eukprot:m.150216 g.150216  ORF g.150216 m.150216 type:complete len:81 (+) comp17371_c1_seq1:459-701(+)